MQPALKDESDTAVAAIVHLVWEDVLRNRAYKIAWGIATADGFTHPDREISDAVASFPPIGFTIYLRHEAWE